MELYRRHPTLAQTLVLSTAFPGWADSLRVDVVAQRLQWCRRETGHLAERFARGWTLGLRMEEATAPVADEVVANLSDGHPAGFRVLARSFAEASFADFPRIDVPTLLLYAVHEERPPRSPPDRKRIPTGKIVTLPGVGNPRSDAAPDRFNAEVLDFLRAHT